MSASAPESRRDALIRHVLYGVLVVVIAVPLCLGIRMTVVPGSRARGVYDTMEGMEPGRPVLLSFDFDPASLAELRPMGRALLLHCFRRGLHPIVMTHWPAGLGLAKSIVEEAAAEWERESGQTVKSGRDFVFLGYKPGYSNLLLNMGENLKDAFDKDFYGQDTAGMEALRGVRSLRDVPFVVDIAAGATIDMLWIPYGRDRFGFALAGGCTGVMAPDLYPFLDSGQLVGLLGGLRGAAEYEVLLDTEGGGITGMAAQSAAHVLIIVLILAANARYLLRRKRQGSRE